MITASGDVKHDVSHKFGDSAMYFDGSGDYLSVPDSDDWDFGSGDFTIDTWVKFDSVATDSGILYQDTDGNNFLTITYQGSEDKIYFWSRANIANTIYCPSDVLSLSADTWYHLAFVRNGSIFKIYKDGVQVGTSSASNAVADTTSVMKIGYASQWSGDDYMNGMIDEFRITKGIARWTSDFTPPTHPYGATETSEVNQIAITYTEGTAPTAPTSLYVHDTNAQSGTAGTGVTITTENPHFSAIYNDPES